MIVYTSIMGDYDPLRPHPDHPSVEEWICYTDNPSLTCEGWTTIVEPARYPHPRLSAKWRKCHPPIGTQSFWIDGSVHLYDASIIDAVSKALTDSDMTMFTHPWRDCIYDEVGASVGMAKYAGLDGRMHQQVGHYATQDWPHNAGLWASTVIGRNDTPTIREFGGAWFAHNEIFSYQDQLSLPYLLGRYNISVAPLPNSLADNPWFHWMAHNHDG